MTYLDYKKIEDFLKNYGYDQETIISLRPSRLLSMFSNISENEIRETISNGVYEFLEVLNYTDPSIKFMSTKCKYATEAVRFTVLYEESLQGDYIINSKKAQAVKLCKNKDLEKILELKREAITEVYNIISRAPLNDDYAFTLTKKKKRAKINLD